MKKGKGGEINKTIKKFLKKEGKDKRGMENLEEKTGGRKTSRRGFLAGALAALMAVGCALLPGKAVEEDFRGEGKHSGEHIPRVYAGDEMPVPKSKRTKYEYEIYKKDGKTYYNGDVFSREDKKQHYHGEIDQGKIVKEIPEENGRIIQLKDGSYIEGNRTIGQRSDGGSIEFNPISSSPILVAPKHTKKFKKVEELEEDVKKKKGVDIFPFWTAPGQRK